jgi:hypothetical protein
LKTYTFTLRGSRLMKKTRRQKSRVRVPLRVLFGFHKVKNMYAVLWIRILVLNDVSGS